MPLGRSTRTPGAAALVAIEEVTVVVATHGIATSDSFHPSGQRMPNGNRSDWPDVFAGGFTRTDLLGSVASAVSPTRFGTHRDVRQSDPWTHDDLSGGR
jgi:hypothetical protein